MYANLGKKIGGDFYSKSVHLLDPVNTTESLVIPITVFKGLLHPQNKRPLKYLL